MNGNRNLTAALGYALRGWQVLPLHGIDDGGGCTCGREACSSPAKHPRIHRWPDRASSNKDQITEWWAKWPAANVGIATGKASGLVVLDVDPRHHGDLSLKDLEQRRGELPTGLRCKTGGDGIHIYLRHPDDLQIRNSANQLAPGLDVRSSGGYVVAPPSSHASGGAYSWQSEPEEQAAEMPAWLVDALTSPRDRAAQEAEATGKKRSKSWQASYAAPGSGEGYGKAALSKEVEIVAAAPEGGRNNTLNRSAWNMGQLVAGGEVGDSEAFSALVDAALRAGLSRQEAEATCRSGMLRGAETPRSRPIRDNASRGRPALADIPEDDWVTPHQPTWALLDRAPPTKDGPKAPSRTGRNAQLVLQNDPRFAGTFWGDQIRGLRFWMDQELKDEHYTEISNKIDALYRLPLSTTAVREQVHLLCADNARDPLSEWLHSLEWDGEERLAYLLSRGFGSDDSVLSRAYSLFWGIGCCARAYGPGCKLDTCLILVGPQGIGKSSGMRDLVGAEWFSDTEINLDNKDSYLALRRPWVHELAELSSLRRARGEKIKALLSSQVDEFRPPYGREIVRAPRRCVVIGTSNEQEILTDATGSRRFWVCSVSRVDREWLRENRAQLWAEAAHYYRGGNEWWLTQDLEEERKEKSVSFLEPDAWESPIVEHLEGKTVARSADIFDHALGLEVSRQDVRAMRRLGAILRRLGWSRRTQRFRGRKMRVWAAPEPAE